MPVTVKTANRVEVIDCFSLNFPAWMSGIHLPFRLAGWCTRDSGFTGFLVRQ